MNRFVFLFLIMTVGGNFTIAQTLKNPSPGKSLVYLVRTSGAGALINFKYFDGDKFLGKFNGVNYLAYECEPGEHIFWASSENRDFVAADLEADKVYIIEVEPRMGAFKAAVHLDPIKREDEKELKKIMKVINKKDPKAFTEEELSEEQQKLEFFIENGLKRYENLKNKGKDVTSLTKEMYHED